jgi:hypothetical protein
MSTPIENKGELSRWSATKQSYLSGGIYGAKRTNYFDSDAQPWLAAVCFGDGFVCGWRLMSGDLA